MVRPNVGYYDPYDFTPVKSPRPARRRLDSERPRLHETSNALAADTNHPSRTQVVPDPSPNAEQDGRAAQRISSAREAYRNGRFQVDDATRSASPVRDRPRRTSRVLGIGELLDSLKQPQPQPAFKVEPVDGDIMDFPERRVTPRKKYNNTRAGTAAASRPTRAYTRRQPQVKPARNEGREEVDHEDQQDAVVDLTADDEENSQAQNHRAGTPGQYQVFATSQRDHEGIPPTALQQIREQYRQENIILPTDVKNWHQLQEFAGRNKNPSRVTPTFIAQIRGFYSTLGLTPPQGPNLSYSQSSLPTQGVSQHQLNNSPNLRTEGSYVFGTQQASLSNAGRLISTSNTASEVAVKLENDAQPSAHSATEGPFVRSVKHIFDNRLRPHNIDSSQIISNPSQRRGPGQLQNNLQPSTAKVIKVQLSDALRDLLPPDAPSDHPHLVSIWDPDLLKLSTNQHDHLNLIDTVVSIIAKYEIKDQSAIKGFLDINAVPHFFFLFKSRTSAWHSWSIEREWDIVTVSRP